MLQYEVPIFASSALLCAASPVVANARS
jgi:hypothetical protein